MNAAIAKDGKRNPGGRRERRSIYSLGSLWSDINRTVTRIESQGQLGYGLQNRFNLTKSNHGWLLCKCPRVRLADNIYITRRVPNRIKSTGDVSSAGKGPNYWTAVQRERLHWAVDDYYQILTDSCLWWKVSCISWLEWGLDYSKCRPKVGRERNKRPRKWMDS